VPRKRGLTFARHSSQSSEIVTGSSPSSANCWAPQFNEEEHESFSLRARCFQKGNLSHKQEVARGQTF
jgi:hypothetical protein